MGDVVVRSSYLPRVVDELIGREAEVDQVLALLAERRLVTLTGAGGVGKSRLALEVASALEPSRVDGVWWVALAELGDPSLVGQSVLSVLGLVDSGGVGPEALLLDYLADRDAVLVLDNCDQVATWYADQVRQPPDA
ncbi:MAG TPA: AAA family ATPase [Nocardioides sp.]|uniref:AAA family ATPase n=1 Tax=uncultured Nocardioides sp. TaxID=198441 RepID=UPI000EBDF988|nr:AAA family ATPase [uncultured Nocardioides sp.]HCB03417.1 hypothetical protein [Nocardioides sp.]HRD63070.1 AAA family ATPase [Nocardioides sp.]HRI95903.1 AAA family ATPase [Nocardioides sp.]HRK46474.1 AAA family ATPase [Nocardioides sp.]